MPKCNTVYGCLTPHLCRKEHKCIQGPSERATLETAGPVGSLCCDAIVSCAPSVVRLLDEQRTAFVMWLNADPRNAEENRFWKSRLDEADAKLREAKRTANSPAQTRA